MDRNRKYLKLQDLLLKIRGTSFWKNLQTTLCNKCKKKVGGGPLQIKKKDNYLYWQSGTAYERYRKKEKEIIGHNLLLLCYWAYLLKCLERIMPPYFILLHISQMAISSNKYPKCIVNLLPENFFLVIHSKRYSQAAN